MNSQSNAGGVRRRAGRQNSNKSSSSFEQGGLRVATDDHPGLFVYFFYY